MWCRIGSEKPRPGSRLLILLENQQWGGQGTARRGRLRRNSHGGHSIPGTAHSLGNVMAKRFQSLFADPYGTPALLRRLLAEQALQHRSRYAVAFLMMGVAAACTALSAYLLGDVVNQAYVHKNFHALLLVGFAAFG